MNLCELGKGLIATCSADNTIKIWDPSKGFACVRSFNESGRVLRFLSNGLLAMGSSDGTVKIVDPERDFVCVYHFKEHTGAIVALEEYTGFLASGSEDNTIKIWKI